MSSEVTARYSVMDVYECVYDEMRNRGVKEYVLHVGIEPLNDLDFTDRHIDTYSMEWMAGCMPIVEGDDDAWC